MQEKLLRLTEVESIVGLKKSKLYSLIKEEQFPPPVKLGGRAVRWRASSVDQWMQSLSVDSSKAGTR